MERVFRLVNVDRRALWTRVDAFSGGNQQKIAIAKWLLAESRILLVYDPTRGIDVGTKNELYLLLRAYAEAGGAILFYSTEIPELVHLADRVMVFYAGRVAAEFAGDGPYRGEHPRSCPRRSRRNREGGVMSNAAFETATTARTARRVLRRRRRLRLGRHRGLIMAAIVFTVLFAVVAGVSATPLGYYDIAQMTQTGATLAIAAVGQTIVILSGGFDLSAAAVISLVNAVLASWSPDGSGSPFVLIALGVGVGMAVRRLQRLLHRRAAAAADRRNPVGHVHPAGCHAADYGEARGHGVARAVEHADRGRHSQRRSGARRSGPRPSGSLALAQAKSARHGHLRDRQRLRGGALGRRPITPHAVPRLCDRRRLLRTGRRVHQRPDRVGRPARRQPDAAPDVRRRGGRRHRARRRAWRLRRLGARRLHPDDDRQHPAGVERLGLLFDRRRKPDPAAGGARLLLAP